MSSKYNSSRIHFHSPLLRPLPQVEKIGRAQRLAWRRPLLTILFALFLGIFFILWLQPFGRTGPGWPLYWLHDYVYLPIKGYTFTLYHPQSWIWWGIIFTLILLWVGSFALDRSFILWWHVPWLKTAINQPLLAAVLVSAARFLNRSFLRRLGFRSRLLASMVEKERRLALNQLRQKASPNQIKTAVHLTKLLIELYLLDEKPERLHYLKSAVCWHETCLQLDVQNRRYGVDVTGGQTELGEIFPSVIKPLTHLDDRTYFARVDEPAGFDYHGLLIELVYLARVVFKGEDVLGKLPKFETGASPEAWLVEAVDRRRFLLYEAHRQLLQSSSIGATPLTLLTDQSPLALFIGQLAMSLAMHITLLTESPETGLAYLEAVEATNLTLQWTDSGDDLLQQLSALSYQLPTTEHYQWIAWLGDKKRRQLQTEVEINNLVGGEKPLLRQSDLDMAEERTLRRHREGGVTESFNKDARPLLPDFDPNRESQANFDRESINLPFRRRADAVLATVLTVAFSLLLTFWFFTVQSLDQLNAFEAPVVGKLKDSRILFNVRDGLPDLPFLDAVIHSDNRIYISQAGGIIHRYDPATGLWSYERPSGGEGLNNYNYVTLRSGCGDDPLSEQAKDCPNPDVLWAVTESGGLIRRNGRSWEIVVGDTAFRGASGRLMNSDDLTTAAVSGDGRWLVVGTQQDGFGVYNLQTRQWLTFSPDLYSNLPYLTITRMVWWQDRFWLAGPRGLTSLSLSGNQPVVADAPIIQGEVIDLDIGLDDTLWALAFIPCENSGDSCLWLGKLIRPDQAPQTIINQRNRYAQLNLAGLTFAQQQGDRLTVAGESGIYFYDTVPHSWQQLFTPAVWAALPAPDNNGFFFAYRDGIGLAQGETITTWESPESNIVKLLYDQDDLLALTGQGNVYALAGNPLTITQVYIGSQTSFDPESFINATGAGDKTLLLGPDGALLHDVRARQYEDISSRLIPDWLRQTTTRFLTAGANIYVLNPLSNGRLTIRSLSANQFLATDYFTSGDIQDVGAQTTTNGVVQVWPWNQAIGVLQNDGTVHRFTPQNQTMEIGPALAGFNNPNLLDVTTLGNNLVMATTAGLVTYNQASRALQQTAAYANLRGIEAYGDTLLLVTTQGDLLRHGTQPTNLIGAQNGFTISDAALSDGLWQEEKLYLAGAGKVEMYDTSLRRVTEQWNLPGQGEARLVGVVQGRPVALSGGRAAWGENELPGEGNVVDLSLDSNYIWTVRQGSGGRYLMGHAVQNPLSSNEARCFFRNPSASNINQIQDARALPGGIIAVASDAGLRFYNLSARSWFAGPDNVLPNGGRLYSLGDYLVAVSSNQDRLWLIRTSGVRMPGSCTVDRVALQDVTAVSIRAVAVDEQTNRLAWITPEGAVIQWQGGQSAELLPPVTEGPDTNAIQRVYQRGNYLFFTTDNALWRYDLPARRWQQINLQMSAPASSIVSINLESPSGNETMVVAQTQNGEFYLGTLAGSSASLSLSRIFMPSSESLNANGNSLLDAQERSDDLWTFVLDNQLRYYNPRQRQWTRSVALPQTDSTLSFQTVFDRGVLVGRNGQTWRVARNKETEPVSFATFELQSNETTYLDDQAVIWRWQEDGTVLRCPLPISGDYSCAVTRSSFWLSPAAVRRAFNWRNLVLFETGTGFLGYNTSAEQAFVLPTELANWPPGSVVRQYGQQLWFYSQNTLLIVRQENNNGQVAVERLTGVSELIYDTDGLPWARFGAEWRRWDNGRFVAPTAVSRIFAWERTASAGLDDAGYPYWWDGRFIRDEFTLPPEIDRSRLTGLWRGGEREWWALTGAQLYHVTEGICHPQTMAPFATATPTPVPTPTPTSVPAPTLPPTWTPEATPIITVTLTPSPTPTPTSTPTPTATPTPVPIPCFVVAGQVNVAPHLGASPTIRRANVAAGTLTLIGNDNRSLDIHRQGSNYNLNPQTNVIWQPAGLAEDRWSVLRNNVVMLPNGREAYNPVTGLTINSAGELIGVRPGVNLKLADQAANQFNLPPPLDVTWLRWNRARRDFSVTTPTGAMTIGRAAFVVNGQFLFEPVAAILAQTSSDIYVANLHGVWRHRSADLRLDDPGIVYQPVSLGFTIEAAHGRFLVNNGDLFPGDTAARPSQTSLSIQVGDITLTESLRGRRVSASGITSVPIFVERGFFWDRNRRGVAFGDSALLLQSDAGIHPVNSLTSFDAGPNQLGRQAGVLRFETGQGVFLRSGNSWYKRNNNNWNLHPTDPTISRTLVTNNIWEWRLVNSAFQVTLTGTARNFNYPQPGNNFTFSSDRLLAAAAHDGQLYAISEAFMEIANGADQLGALSANRLAPLTADSLESFRFADNSTALYRYVEDVVFRWNGATQQFNPISATDDPRQKRELVQTDRLRLSYDRQQLVAVTKQLRVNRIQGGEQWIAFSFERGRFPFDLVTAVAVHQNRLYVGSQAGLQVYARLATGLSEMSHLYDLRPSPTTNTFMPVERLGIPRDNPDLLMARSSTHCIQTGGTAFTVCPQAPLLDWRLRTDTFFWQWLAGPNDQISGRYYDFNGVLIANTIRIENGRFPHDRLQNLSVCSGRAFTLWQNGWITISPNESLRLSAGTQTFPGLQDQTLQRFICLDKEIPLPGTTVPAGLYVEGGNEDSNLIWRHAQNDWRSVGDARHQAGVIDHGDRPPVWEQARLRLPLRQDNSRFTFQQRGLDNIWRDISWESGRLAIDRWHELVVVNGNLWAATPTGLVSFQRDRSGQVMLNPDRLLVVREPGSPCRITDLEEIEEQVWARCQANSNQVYYGQLDGSADRNIFRPVSNAQDPFVERLMVDPEETGYWEFRLTGRSLGASGSLRVWLHGEAIELAGGQFVFDTINSLAFLPEMPVNVGATEGGWFQVNPDDWHVREWLRPSTFQVAPQAVSRVGVTKIGGVDNQTLALCLDQGDTTFLRLSPGEDAISTIACPEYLVDHQLWRYQQEDGRFWATAVQSIGGVGYRDLNAGRFTDDIVIGPPVSGHDGDTLFYLFPTKAGVIEYNQNWQSTLIYGAPFPGLTSPPASLLLVDGEPPLYVGLDGLYTLDNARNVYLPVSLPSDVIPIAAEYTVDNLWRLHWLRQNQMGWVLVDPRNGENLTSNLLPVNVSQYGKFITNYERWGNPSPWIAVILNPDTISFSVFSRPLYHESLPADFVSIKPIVYKDQIVLIGEQELLSINIEYALVKRMSR